MKHPLTKKFIRASIKDEKVAIKDYRAHGLMFIARDEARHLAFMKMLLKSKKR